MPRRTTPTLSAALDEFLEIRATHVAKTTLTNDTALLRKFIREIGPSKHCHQLDARTLEKWFAAESVRQKGQQLQQGPNTCLELHRLLHPPRLDGLRPHERGPPEGRREA